MTLFSLAPFTAVHSLVSSVFLLRQNWECAQFSTVGYLIKQFTKNELSLKTLRKKKKRNDNITYKCLLDHREQFGIKNGQLFLT